MIYYPATSPLKTLIRRFTAVLLLYIVTRYIFLWMNKGAFSGMSFPIFWAGLRFDVAAICITNSIYFLFLLLPFSFIERKMARTIGNVYFVAVNAIALMTNLIDCCYYPFAMRRLTGDIFSFIDDTNNFGQLIPMFLKEYWYVGVIWLMLIALLLFIAWLTEANNITTQDTDTNPVKTWVRPIFLRLLFIFLILTGARGGWQKRPLSISYASNAAGIENAALVLNTPYSLVTTLDSQGLARLHYFSDEECDAIFSTEQYFPGVDNDKANNTLPDNANLYHISKPKNVVIIILEGISSEYSTYLADEPKALAGYTPFLDSLAKKSIVFRGYANGQQSIEALSSILGGIPSLMSKPFSQSRYAACNIQYAIPNLKKAGMHTLFFHGGENGTMGFDRSSKMTGIDEYFGLNEYDPECLKEDFDGSWGIEDVPYLQYVAKQLSLSSEPFFATVFTLSSHHPFVVPKEYDQKLPQGNFPMQHCVAYTDEALRQFFEQASLKSWYANTLFVITADHTNFSDANIDIDYLAHRYSVPMIFFYPKANTAYKSNQIVQQVDILPSIIDYCGLPATFSSFGHSAFDTKAPHFAVNYLSGVYEMYYNNLLIEFDGQHITHVYDISNGSQEIKADAIPDIQSAEKLLKAVIQRFNNGLLDNNLHENSRPHSSVKF